MLSKLDEAELEFASCLARSIWLRRNSVVFGGPFTPLARLVKSVTDSLMDCHTAGQISESGWVSHNCPHRQTWQKPPNGVIKFNLDAALDVGSKKMGVGLIARDAAGVVVATKCSFMHPVSDSAIADQVIGAWKAVLFCQDLGLQCVIIEGDGLEIVQALRRDDSCWSRYG